MTSWTWSPTASTPLINSASVSGGSEGDLSNDAASDSTTVTPAGVDLTPVLSHTTPVEQAGTSTYSAVVQNQGAGATVASVAFNETFPTGLTPTAASVSATAVPCGTP